MLWTLFRGYASYGTKDEDGRPPGLVGQLDPIECAGSVDMKGLKKSAARTCPAVLRILLVILQLASFLEAVNPTPTGPRRLKFTSPKYQGLFDHLEKAKILVPAAEEELRHCMGYFSVAKGSTVDRDGAKVYLDRAIVNGKNLSGICEEPPGCNIPDITRLMYELCKLNSEARARGRRLSIVSGDLRHWFHQLSLNPEITPWFGLVSGGDRGHVTVILLYKKKTSTESAKCRRRK
jgi:hypothetical protein